MSLYKPHFEIRNNILNYMENNLSKGEGSYNFDIASAVSFEISDAYLNTDDLAKELVPWTCTRDPYLTFHMISYGLTRLEATKAKGSITAVGSPFSIVPEGSIVLSRLGVKYITLDTMIFSASGIATSSIEAIEGGEVGNCGVGDITKFELVLTNVEKVYNEEAITGGAAIESVESCIARMKEKASVPSHSGNKNNYRQWVKETGGVGKIEVVGSGEHGVAPGHVEIFFTTSTGEIPSEEQVAYVQNYLNREDRIPVCASVLVKPFVELTTNFHFDSVSVRTGSITKEEFITSLTDAVRLAYATDGFITSNVVPLSRISALVFGINGVVLYDNLTVNGATSNIPLEFNEAPIVGTITIDNFVEV